MISFISCIYYNMLIAYSFFYTFASFAADVPWRDCGNAWNKPGNNLINLCVLYPLKVCVISWYLDTLNT